MCIGDGIGDDAVSGVISIYVKCPDLIDPGCHVLQEEVGECDRSHGFDHDNRPGDDDWFWSSADRDLHILS